MWHMAISVGENADALSLGSCVMSSYVLGGENALERVLRLYGG